MQRGQLARRDRRLARGLRAITFGTALAAQLVGAGSVAALTSQTITFSLPAFGLVDATVPLTGTASSGLPVSYASTTEDICTVDADSVQLLDQGTCTVIASQAGDEEYDPAPDVQASMLAKLAQAIEFVLPASGFVGAGVPLSGTATSGLDVGYASTTPEVCAVVGTTLDLLGAGTCDVTASQPGDDAWTPAEDVTASMLVKLPPYTSPDGANLGRYAFNGYVRTLAIDQQTGVTYVGGNFTQVGIRTGAVAVVDPPGSGSDSLQNDNPDIVANGIDIIPDDATGYFITGTVGSVNGDGVHRQGIFRMTAAGTVDTTWQADDPCDTGVIPTWDLGDSLAGQTELSGDGSGFSTMGLIFTDKQTGDVTFAGDGDADCTSGARFWGSIGPFAPLAACAGWYVCTGHVTSVTEDAARNLLITEVQVISRPVIDPATQVVRRYLVAYDTAAGSREWSVALQDPNRPPDFPPQAQWTGEVTTMVGLDGAVLVRGLFPLDEEDWTLTRSTMLLVDTASGSIVQRWNADGEQDLADPSQIIAPTTTCVNPQYSGVQPLWKFVSLGSETGLGYASHEEVPGGFEVAVCAYAITGSGNDATLGAEVLGTFFGEPDPGQHVILPSTIHAGRYVVGGNGAFDLQIGEQVPAWNPSPSAAPQSVVSLGSSVVLGGNLVFVHGDPASHVAALDENLAPIGTFSAELPDTENSSNGIQDIWQIVLADGKLVVAGDLKGDFGRGPVVALDPATGELLWSYAEEDLVFGLTVAADTDTGSFYLGASRVGPGDVLFRFVGAGDGFVLDEAFDHALTAYAGARHVTGLAYTGGRLYIGGQFGSVDGEARQGLARLTNGALDGWAPKPVDELDPDPGDSIEFQPARFVELDQGVVVSGSFWRLVPLPGGGGSQVVRLPGLVVYSQASGARVKPVGTNDPWFPDDDFTLDMVVAEGTLFVAMGGTGIGAFDAATLAYLPSRSVRTQAGWEDNVVLALGLREGSTASQSGATAQARTAGASVEPASLVLGGDLDHWNNVSAGNVVETLPSEPLEVTRSGSGKGIVASQPAGIACGPTCTFRFPVGTSVTLTATAVPGATFNGWSGAGCSGSGTCTVSLTRARSVTASFADKAKPTVGTPTASFRSGSKLSGSALPIRISWTASDTGGSGIKRYEVARSTNGGDSWKTISTSLASPALNATVPSSGSVRYRARAVDKAGNVGSWVAGPTLKPRLVQQSNPRIAYTKIWTTVNDSGCSGGSARYAKAAGAAARYAFTGRAIAFVATTGSNRGQLRIFVNGTLQATVDLRSSNTKFRVVAWQKSWATAASRTVRIEVVGTSGRPRVDLDAFAVLK